MDKYWITFSQWHKSSAAAGFEAACGVVRHFKRSCVAPFEGMVNRGIQRALRQTGLREVTSFFLGWSSRDLPRWSLPDTNETVCLHLRPCPSLLHRSPSPQLSGFICSHLHLSSNLPPSRGHLGFGSLLSSRPISYHCRCSPLEHCKQGEVKASESFFTFVNKKKLPFTAQFIDKGIMYRCMQASITW